MEGSIATFLQQTLVLIPAYNEEDALPELLAEIARELPGTPVAVVDDGSPDQTAAVARMHGATVLQLPCNMGVGPAVQTGFQYALEQGFRYVLRIDADGQHPPAEAKKMIRVMIEAPTDLVVGTRYGEGSEYHGTATRQVVLKGLSWFVSLICRQRITDPTSGFWLVSRPLARCFALHYPSDYPEAESIALLRRQGFSLDEVPVAFRPRQAGVSTIQPWNSVLFAAKVFLALVVDRLRSVDRRGSAHYIKKRFPE